MKQGILLMTLLLISAISFAQIGSIAPKTPNPPKKTGTISINSITPSVCTVKINGEHIGKTPVNIKKGKGKYTITFEAEGYETLTKTVNVIVGKTTKYDVILELKKLTPKDSLLLIANEILTMKTYYMEDFVLNDEGKNIVSLQQNTLKYARNIIDIYKTSVSKEKASGNTDEELKAIITNNVLRMQNNTTLETSCTKQSIKLITDLQKTKSNVKVAIQFVYSTLLKLSKVSEETPLTQEKTNQITELIGQVKFAEAAGIIDDCLLQKKIIERYSLFLKFLKDFFNAGNMRLEELKKEANSK